MLVILEKKKLVLNFWEMHFISKFNNVEIVHYVSGFFGDSFGERNTSLMGNSGN